MTNMIEIWDLNPIEFSMQPSSDVARLKTDLTTRTCKTEIVKPIGGGPGAWIPYAFATAAVMFLAKAYFESFLKEAGKDHYQTLKKAVAGFLNSRRKEEHAIDRDSLSHGFGPEFTSKVTSEFSNLISIQYQLTDNDERPFQIGMLVSKGVQETEIKEALETFHVICERAVTEGCDTSHLCRHGLLLADLLSKDFIGRFSFM
jgi:hypothetical protein